MTIIDHDEFFTALGRVVRREREFLDLSQRALAERAGLAENTIFYAEHASRKIGFSVLVALANGLDLYPSDLLRATEREIEKNQSSE